MIGPASGHENPSSGLFLFLLSPPPPRFLKKEMQERWESNSTPISQHQVFKTVLFLWRVILVSQVLAWGRRVAGLPGPSDIGTRALDVRGTPRRRHFILASPTLFPQEPNGRSVRDSSGRKKKNAIVSDISSHCIPLHKSFLSQQGHHTVHREESPFTL